MTADELLKALAELIEAAQELKQMPSNESLKGYIADGLQHTLGALGVAVDTAPHPLLSAPTLYGRTGDVKDCNTLLVNRGELRAALGVAASEDQTK